MRCERAWCVEDRQFLQDPLAGLACGLAHRRAGAHRALHGLRRDADGWWGQSIRGACCGRVLPAGRLEPHIVQLREVYRQRCQVLLHALERHMPPGVTWTHPRGGFFVWLTLPEGVRSGPLKQAACAHGVLFVPGTGFFANGGGERNLRLAFSFVRRMRSNAP